MNELELKLVKQAKQIDKDLMKPLYVLRMALASKGPGWEKRALNASKEILDVVGKVK